MSCGFSLQKSQNSRLVELYARVWRVKEDGAPFSVIVFTQGEILQQTSKTTRII